MAVFAERRSGGRIQFIDANGRRAPWCARYFAQIQATYASFTSLVRPDGDDSTLLDLLATRVEWPIDPEVGLWRRDALAARVFVVTALSLLDPARFATVEAVLWSEVWATLLDGYYRRVVLGKENTRAHEAWAKRELEQSSPVL